MTGKLAMCVHMGTCETRREWFSGEGCRTEAEDWRNVPRTSSGARSHEACIRTWFLESKDQGWSLSSATSELMT